MVHRSPTFVIVTAVVVSLLATGVASARFSWLTNSHATQSETIDDALLASAATETTDPNIQPVEFDGPVHRSVTDLVRSIPALGSLKIREGTDIDHGSEHVAIVDLVAEDGSRVEIVTQRRPVPLDLSLIGPPEQIKLTEGPNGEDIVARDAGDMYQVVAIDKDGLTVNILVERINRTEPGARTVLHGYTMENVIDWAVELLTAPELRSMP